MDRTLIRIICIFFALTSVVSEGMAQGKWFERGQAEFNRQNYPEAIKLFKFSEKKEGSYRTRTAIANCYHQLREFQEAVLWFQKSLEDENAPAETHYFLGKSLMNTGQYAQAAQSFQQFRNLAPADKRSERFVDVQAQLERLLSDSAIYEVSAFPFNSKESDFSPFPLGSGIIFSSARKKDLAVIHTSTIDNAPLLDLYAAVQDSAGSWKRPKPVPGDLNTRFNEGPAFICPGDTLMYFTRNFFNKGMKKATDSRLNKLKILEARKEKEEWKVTGEFPYNNNDYAVGHPALSPDGNTLYFASDMQGGAGGTDIWYCTKTDEGWSQPQNPGHPVNTEGDEMFPFVAEDGNLYFASDAHFGLGGLDIFKSRRLTAGWSNPVNMGYPVNSQADDFGLYLFPDRKRGYFSSNRTDGGGKNDDLFAFSVLIPEFECFPQEENFYCYRFFEPDTIDVASLPVIYEWDFGDGNRAAGIETIHCYEEVGDYIVKLNLIDTVSGYLFLNQSIRTISPRDIEQVFIDCPDTVMAGENIQLSGSKSIIPAYPDAAIREYYWNIEGNWYQGENLTYAFQTPGKVELRLGVVADIPNSSEEVKDCITRQIVVLGPDRYNEWRDSVRNAEKLNVPRIDRRLQLVDSIKSARALEEKVSNLADSTGQVYSVQVARTANPIPDHDPILRQIDSVKVIQQDNKFNYLVGQAPDLKGIYPTFRELKEKGFTNALVVAVRNGNIISQNDSVFYIRDAESDKTYQITLVKGMILDSAGNPLQALIKLEDLEKGNILKQVDTKDGQFVLELPGGKVYGYIAEVEGYLPYSNYIDLRNPEFSESGSDLVIRDEIQMVTMRQVIEQGLPVRLNNVFFDFDSDKLRPESKNELDRLARLIGEHPHLKVEIMGHTDWDGSAEYNLDLSDRRARSVVRYLILNGIPTDRITANGYGEARPMATNETPEGRQLNRRVEFRFIPRTR